MFADVILRDAHRRPAGGFTLLEMLTVLVIIGMTAGVIGPRLPLMKDRFDYALKRETFEESLGGLSYQAFRDNRDLVLQGAFDEHGPVVEEQKDDNALQEPIVTEPVLREGTATQVDLPPIAPGKPHLNLPEGWRLVAKDPIYIRANGFCKGGDVELVIGKAHYVYTLTQPQCTLTIKE